MRDTCPHQTTPQQCDHCRRGLLLADLTAVIDELLDHVATREKVDPTAVPGWKPPTDGRPTPRRIDHHTHAAGLITQLEQAAGTARPHATDRRGSIAEARSAFIATARAKGATHADAERMAQGYAVTPTPNLIDAGPAGSPKYGADVTSHTKPGSRPPTSLQALETLANIEAAAVQLRQRADHAANITTLGRSRGIRGELRHLTWLLETAHPGGRPLLNDHWGQRIYRETRTWAADARVTLSYLAPIVTLQVVCPDCGGQLKVRADATSDVWCIGRWHVEGPALEVDPWPISYRCGAVWPRLTWIQLLDTTKGTP